jgi:lipoprotein-anchoring transpeptidase ErfK/SrfK
MIYLPKSLKTIKLPEGERFISYCENQPATVSEVIPTLRTDRASFVLPRANILIARSQRQLTLFDGNSPVRQYPVAIGKPTTPTPLGNYAIATKIMNPGGVLGTRWMGLNFDAYGVHGTNTH